MKTIENFRTSFPHLGENSLALRYYFRSLGEIKKSQPLNNQAIEMYPEPGSNRHSRNGHRILSPACLPIPPSGQKM